MEPEFVNLTPENLADEHLSCIIRVKKPHPGVEAKRRWLADRLREGGAAAVTREPRPRNGPATA